LPQVWEIARSGLPRLEYGLLATSGLNVQRTLDQTEDMLCQIESNPGVMRSFEVQISLDGIDEMHDHVRGIEGFFQKVQRTLEGLQRLKERYPMLLPKLSAVIMPDNVGQVEPIQQFAKEVNMSVHFSPAVLTGTFFNNLEEAEVLGFVPGAPKTAEAQEAFQKLSEEESGSLRFYYQDIVKMLDGSPRGRTCLMGFFGCLIEHTGDVYPCPIWENKSFGNLLEKSFDEVWFGEEARAARYSLRRTGCPTCTSMCYPHSVGPSEIMQEKGARLQERAKRAASKLFAANGREAPGTPQPAETVYTEQS
jgi:radical SAM protein with 4Fe4S-binding SPASM domain